MNKAQQQQQKHYDYLIDMLTEELEHAQDNLDGLERDTAIKFYQDYITLVESHKERSQVWPQYSILSNSGIAQKKLKKTT